MVVFTHIPGVEVTIEVDGIALREYEDNSEDRANDRDHIIRYIEAQPGKEFAIAIRLAPRLNQMRTHSITSDVKVDGNMIVRPIFNKTENDHGATRIVDGVEQKNKNGWEKHRLMFANLNIDHATARPTGSSDKHKELGEISITMWLGNVTGKSEDQNSSFKLNSADHVHEKALKGRAVSLNTKIGRVVSCKQPNYLNFDKQNKSPFATVLFRYRTLADLKSEMIVPRSPSPAAHDEFDDLSPEQMREMLRRQRQSSGTFKREVKRERHDDENDSESGDGSDGFEIVNPPKRQRIVEEVDLTGE